ncbi:MAG: SAM-dependent methyltransferase, partial [Sphingobacteriales bacterium]
CWSCKALERHRILWKYLKEESDFLKRHLRLLHIAPEPWFYPYFEKNPATEYYPGDLEPEGYWQNGQTAVVKTDLTQLQYVDNFFDLIIANHVLEHIPNDIKAMSEMYRVLKKGGTAIFMTPIFYHPRPLGYDTSRTYEDFSITTEEGRLKAFGQSDHVRVYGTDFKDRVESVGFTYKEFNHVGKLSKKELYRYGMETGDAVQYGLKSIAAWPGRLL